MVCSYKFGFLLVSSYKLFLIPKESNLVDHKLLFTSKRFAKEYNLINAISLRTSSLDCAIAFCMYLFLEAMSSPTGWLINKCRTG